LFHRNVRPIIILRYCILIFIIRDKAKIMGSTVPSISPYIQQAKS
jgi:hypothetical protein